MWWQWWRWCLGIVIYLFRYPGKVRCSLDYSHFLLRYWMSFLHGLVPKHCKSAAEDKFYTMLSLFLALGTHYWWAARGNMVLKTCRRFLFVTSRGIELQTSSSPEQRSYDWVMRSGGRGYCVTSQSHPSNTSALPSKPPTPISALSLLIIILGMTFLCHFMIGTIIPVRWAHRTGWQNRSPIADNPKSLITHKQCYSSPHSKYPQPAINHSWMYTLGKLLRKNNMCRPGIVCQSHKHNR